MFCIHHLKKFDYWETSPFDFVKKLNGKDTILRKNNDIIFSNDSSIYASYDWERDIKTSVDKKNSHIYI